MYQDSVVHIGSHFGVMRQHLVEMWGGCNEWPRDERMGYMARRLLVLLAPSSQDVVMVVDVVVVVVMVVAVVVLMAVVAHIV